MLLSLTGIAGAESEVRRQDHCTATDRFTIWKGMYDLVLIACMGNWIVSSSLYIDNVDLLQPPIMCIRLRLIRHQFCTRR